VFVLIVHINLV